MVSRPTLPLTCHMMIDGTGKICELLGEDIPLTWKFEISNTNTDVLVREDTLSNINKVITKKTIAKPKLLGKILESGMAASNTLIAAASGLAKGNLGELNKKQLAERFEQYVTAFTDLTPALIMPFAIEILLTKRIKAKIKELNTSSNNDAVENVFRKLTIVQRDSDTFLEQKDLLEIAQLCDNGKDTHARLKKHAERFGYMGLTNNLLSTPYDASYFEQATKQVKKPAEALKTLLDNRASELKEYRRFANGLDAELVADAELLQGYMFFRAYRIDAMKKSQWVIKPLLEEICERCSITFEDICRFVWPEVLELLESGRVPDIEPRKNYFTVGTLEGKLFWNTDPIVAMEIRYKGAIKGTVASQGVAEGIVKIVATSNDISKVHEGNVLVTSMTTPDMVIAMREAAAIVTDEGGILCHAAIVSREFGIPCIIATEIATKVLKDGDRVKVDAIKGTVEKVSVDG